MKSFWLSDKGSSQLIMKTTLPVTNEIRERARSFSLSSAERSRYSRHLLLPEVGVDGQLALKASRVLVIGAGGLGSPVSLYLAAAGVGHLGLVDFDEVDVTNLQRQILFNEGDTGSSKSEVGAARLTSLNSHIRIEPVTVRLAPDNVMELFSRFDIIVDGTDNFTTRYLVNDAAVLLGKPVVYGSIFRFDGQASLLYAPHGPCYRCLFPKPPPPGQVPNCAEGGVLGVLPGIVGVIQATEALKLITGIGASLLGRLLTYDAASMKYAEYSFRRDPACQVCGDAPTITTVAEVAAACQVGSAEESASGVRDISAADFVRMQADGAANMLIDVRTSQERQVCVMPGAVHIPLAEFGERLHEIPRDRSVVIHCKSGQRSRTACEVLLRAGYQDVVNLAGGILAWIDETGAPLSKY
jgi:adenylyltransferase/sulfurtransferase